MSGEIISGRRVRLVFFTEARLGQSDDGKYYSADQSFSYQMFRRYLKVFDNVLIVARCRVIKKDAVDEKTRVDGNGVNVLPLPHYIGPYQYLITRHKIIRKLRKYIDSNLDAAMICRVPGTIGTAAAEYLLIKKKPYGVEVVGDPADVFAAGSFHHPLRPVFRYSTVKSLKAVVKSASASIYVTKHSLQLRYPPGKNQFTTYASNVMLGPEAFAAEAKKLKGVPPFSIVTVGSLSAMYKSPDVAIEAIAILKRNGVNATLQWLGDGKYRSKMIQLARQAGVADRIKFIGNVSTAAEVRKYLDAADLFVLPSRMEGLPRALVEAMARGLPCIGTAIGGIPELLEEVALVPVNNPNLLADKISTFLSTPGLADGQAARNLKEARFYALELLESRRTQFYRYLRDIS
ncbi:glycosyltransferase [Desulfosoma sp.]